MYSNWMQKENGVSLCEGRCLSLFWSIITLKHKWNDWTGGLAMYKSIAVAYNWLQLLTHLSPSRLIEQGTSGKIRLRAL